METMNRVNKFTQAYSQTPRRKQLQFLVQAIVLLIMAAIVASLYLNLSERTTRLGMEIKEIQEENEVLKKEISDLNAKYAFLISSEEMRKRALAMGFEPRVHERTLFMLIPGYIERQPANLASPQKPQTAAVETTLPDSYTESLLNWLQRELSNTTLQDFLEITP